MSYSTGTCFIGRGGAFAASLLLSTALPALADEAPPPQPNAQTAPDDGKIEKVTVTGERLDKARSNIEPKIGASTYTINQQAIDAQPGGDNNPLNQVMLQAPSVVQDSFGQLHVRGEHNAIQYRLNGIILPEGISVFGQTLDAHIISSVQLITGAMPAEYGLRTAGIIDVKTRSGLFEPEVTTSVYGGSHGLIEPSFNAAGSAGTFNYFVTGDYLQSGLGIDSPDGRSDPIHDDTTQYHGFGYLDDILDDSNRISLIAGISHDDFQIPDRTGQSPGLGLTVQGQTVFPSDKIDEDQREITQFAIASFQHSQGAFDIVTSLSTRYSSLYFSPDDLPDLLYNGISQHAFRNDLAIGLQTDSAYRLNETHTIRAGFYIQHDHSTSDTTSLVLPTDTIEPEMGVQTSDIPIAIVDNSTATQWIYSAYLQDEWMLCPDLTVNYGLRFDAYKAFASEGQVSPRINVVWTPAEGTTFHAGYAKYFTPPPFELIANETVAKFDDTTGEAPGTQNDISKAERAHYFDVGAQQKLMDNRVTLGVDSYFKMSHNLIDEGQFGAPIILTPFNYKDGKQYGFELTAAYDSREFSAYANFALQHAFGKDITSAQFNFDPGDLAFIQNHYIHLDHEQPLTASAGASYLWEGTRFSADLLVGSGLRTTTTGEPNGAHLPTYEQVNVGASHAFELPGAGVLTARFDVINVFDQVYEIRDGGGIGVGASQFGPRRGFFVGLSETL